MEKTPLFIGLTRPVSFIGLPLSYVVILMMAVVGGFVLTKSFIYLVGSGIISYAALRALASYDARIFDVFFIVCQRTPITSSMIKGKGVTYRA